MLSHMHKLCEGNIYEAYFDISYSQEYFFFGVSMAVLLFLEPLQVHKHIKQITSKTNNQCTLN